MSVRIVYRDIAVGSDTDASVSATGQDALSAIALLPFGVAPKKYVTLEHNLWALDGSWHPYDGGDIAFWSNDLTDEDGVFATPPTITISFDEQYTTTGVSFIFSGDGYCSKLNIKWYQGATLLDEENFYPEAQECFCPRNVTAFNKVVITLLKTSLPYRRARLDSILMGVVRTFYRDELMDVGVEQEIDGSGRELIADALDWTLHSKEVIDYIFQFKQPVSAYDDDTLIGVYYITDSSRRSDTIFDITCTDAIGVLDNDPYPDRYCSSVNALTLAQDICGEYSVDMDASLTGKTVSGVIVGCTRRMALQQLCFAIGAIADTSGTNKIRIFPLPTVVTEDIDENRIRTGASVKTNDIVTQVRLTSHSYSTSGTGDSVVINGVTYYDTKAVTTINNPDATASDLPNVIEVQDATLVSPANVAEIAQRLYEWYTRRETHQFSFRVEDEKIGDCVQTVTPWGSHLTGNYTKGSLTLSGIVLSRAEVRA